MSDQNTGDPAGVTPVALDPNDPAVKALIAAAVDEQLKDIKAKLNTAYGARDTALARVAELEDAARKADIQRLKDEGKAAEALQKELDDAKGRLELISKQNTELTRDSQVRSLFGKLEFQSERAYNMALAEVTAELIKNANGEWVHKTGKTVSDFVGEFAGNDNNRFLFKQKVNSGGGSASPAPGEIQKKGSLFEMNPSDVMKLAEQGKLRNRKK